MAKRPINNFNLTEKQVDKMLAEFETMVEKLGGMSEMNEMLNLALSLENANLKLNEAVSSADIERLVIKCKGKKKK